MFFWRLQTLFVCLEYLFTYHLLFSYYYCKNVVSKKVWKWLLMFPHHQVNYENMAEHCTAKHYFDFLIDILTLKYWVGVKQVNLTWCGEGAFSALIGHPYSDGVIIKMPYEVDVLLHRPALRPIFSFWIGYNLMWLIVRSVEAGGSCD